MPSRPSPNPSPGITPVHSRAPTPLLNRYRQRFVYAEPVDSLQSRSRSRARPGEDRVSSTTRRGLTAVPIRTKDGVEMYPRDQRGEELGKNARIWRIYTDEARKADARMTEGWNRSIDVLLVFTGLFSAVQTTFIIQTYQMMVPNGSDTTNALLVQLLSLQFGNTVLTNLPTTSSVPPTHWVNGLWFAALACSLSTALISMLAKQWLQAYVPHVSGTLQYRSRQRQSRYMQLEAWHVPAIIDALPLLLHVALLLFFAGLIVLMWTADLAITIATWAIVAFAYIFYLASVCLPLIYDDCPYYHPVTNYLRLATGSRNTRYPSPQAKTLLRAKKNPDDGARSASHDLVKSSDAMLQDILDASALVWLFSKSADTDVVSAALQALAGLPRDFSALGILREAGALPLVEQGFQDCFHKDTTVDLQWHLIDAEGAELYCRAWIQLTRGTSKQWPLEIIEPLWLLQDSKLHPDAAAIASCAVALSSFESQVSQWELLAYLSKYASGELQLSQATQCCLLDSIIECMVLWEMPAAVIEETTVRAIPTLLRILRLTGDLPTSNLRSAAALALYVFTCGPVNLTDYRNEDKRRADYCELTLESLSALVEAPERFGVRDTLMDITSQELCRLAASVVAQSERFPQALREIARSSLSQLFIDGKIGVGIVPDSVLADVLRLLYPPFRVPDARRPLFVTTLVEILEITSHPDITSWSVRLLEILLHRCSVVVLKAFTVGNGINAVLRATKVGLVDSRRLQIDSLRTLCAFIDSSTRLSIEGQQDDSTHAILNSQFNLIFESDFFDTLVSVIAERRWWLFEVSGHWMPALVQLCRIRPHEDVWKIVIKVFRDFAERNDGEDGYTETLRHLDTMTKLYGRNGNGSAQ
ncbi:hypothetical protein IW261DRAFT_1489514 [Armillaria novae-zelandiae]|uniref:DUF6535 domain-containing protein n=1 Tax=Armillaria novae-zelandiae TaxID=153914 RepID=A0AA39P342_9AGAR|nr:hypothetical protein IW261DRAFT_1489514 [Armillaria novae-zelandiae]